jgi:hypothetical protein
MFSEVKIIVGGVFLLLFILLVYGNYYQYGVIQDKNVEIAGNEAKINEYKAVNQQWNTTLTSWVNELDKSNTEVATLQGKVEKIKKEREYYVNEKVKQMLNAKDVQEKETMANELLQSVLSKREDEGNAPKKEKK